MKWAKGQPFCVYTCPLWWAPGTQGFPGGPCSGGKETILIAEDHEALRALASETLEARGYHVILASDGAEAVQVFKASRDKIQVVILGGGRTRAAHPS